MNLMEQVQPNKSAPKVQINIIETKFEEVFPTSFTELDSMITVEAKKVEHSTHSIFDISSYCNSYILNVLSMKSLETQYQKKFTNELGYIQYTTIKDQTKIINNYLETKYNKLSFNFETKIKLIDEEVIINISDSLYTKDDIIIVPTSYKYIITDIAKLLKLDKNIQTIQGSEIINLGTNPYRKSQNNELFTIDSVNHNICDTCPFKIICNHK